MTDGHSEQFFELLQVALGTRRDLARTPSEDEWMAIYAEARRHCILGVLLQALQRDGGRWGDEHGLPLDLKLRWIGKGEKIADENRKLNAQCRQLSAKLTASGYWNCILKGQGMARLYPHPEWRQSGDIDVWVPGPRCRTIEMTRRVSRHREEVTYHHTHFRVFPDTEVEVHFTPTWMFSPLDNHRLQRWFATYRRTQTDAGFPVPETDFNLLYILLHIYRHVFDGGVGLRQVIDYFYVLREANGGLRADFRRFGLQRFARGLMWVMERALGMPRAWMIAEPDERVGKWLLREICEAGNLGHSDKRNEGFQFTHNRMKRMLWRMRLALPRMRFFPGESAWEMPWRIWHYLWRWRHGYF